MSRNRKKPGKKPARPARPPRVRKERSGGFSPDECAIFKYDNGAEEVWADPILLYRKLLSQPDLNLEIDGKLVQTDTPEAPKAFERIVEAVRAVFHVEPFVYENGKKRGLTEGQCFALLAQFGAYLAELKEETLPFVTSPPTTAPQPSPGGDSPTENSADSTSTDPAPSSEEPTA